MDFDVVVVGAGPAGLAAACRYAQLARAAGSEPSICVVEKGSTVGAHVISGAVIEPRALDELFPDWQARGAPLRTRVTSEQVAWLPSDGMAVPLPPFMVPRAMRNEGNYIASLGELCRWLAAQAETLGCSILPGFAAVDVLYDGDRVAGVVTGDMGVARDGTSKAGFQPGYGLRAKCTIFAEGCRGHLGKRLEAKFELRRGIDPQHYGIGFKEVWEIDAARHRAGDVLHTFGWPLGPRMDGGGFVYHAANSQVFLGYIVSLAYRNPHLDPFGEFQRWKQHPRIRSLLEGGQRVAYGARAVNKGGLSSLPRFVVPGGLLVGCEAGFLNPAKIKGTHTAMKTGMLAAEAAFSAVQPAVTDPQAELERFTECLEASWAGRELAETRNFAPGVARFGPLLGGAFAFIEQNVLRGRTPFVLRNSVPDHSRLVTADRASAPQYPRPDGRVSFDRMSSVFLSATAHAEDQPVHLVLADPRVPVDVNLPTYAEPAQRYCPAGVYELVLAAGGAPELRINAANCVHCKTCDIKDPAQNITWVPPEGGGGPHYTAM